MDYKLPKPYLSYSAMTLFLKDKAAFRLKYYEGIKPPETKYTLFGHEVHLALQYGKYPHIPRYYKPEFKIETMVDDIPVLGVLDSFSLATRAFLDYKTSKNKWSDVDVQKLDQLPFYSVLVENKFGKVQPTCKVVVLETQPKMKKIEFDGHTLEGETDELELTGYHQVFRRKIEPWERDRMRGIIIETAKAISIDYEAYLLAHPQAPGNRPRH